MHDRGTRVIGENLGCVNNGEALNTTLNVEIQWQATRSGDSTQRGVSKTPKPWQLESQQSGE